MVLESETRDFEEIQVVEKQVRQKVERVAQGEKVVEEDIVAGAGVLAYSSCWAVWSRTN